MEKFGVGGANEIPRLELRTTCDDAVNQPRWKPAENNCAAPGAAGHDLPGHTSAETVDKSVRKGGCIG